MANGTPTPFWGLPTVTENEVANIGADINLLANKVDEQAAAMGGRVDTATQNAAEAVGKAETAEEVSVAANERATSADEKATAALKFSEIVTVSAPLPSGFDSQDIKIDYMKDLGIISIYGVATSSGGVPTNSVAFNLAALGLPIPKNDVIIYSAGSARQGSSSTAWVVLSIDTLGNVKLAITNAETGSSFTSFSSLNLETTFLLSATNWNSPVSTPNYPTQVNFE